jgi:hypothetical protein
MVMSGREQLGLSPVAMTLMKAALAFGGVLVALRIIGLS